MDFENRFIGLFSRVWTLQLRSTQYGSTSNFRKSRFRAVFGSDCKNIPSEPRKFISLLVRSKWCLKKKNYNNRLKGFVFSIIFSRFRWLFNETQRHRRNIALSIICLISIAKRASLGEFDDKYYRASSRQYVWINKLKWMLISLQIRVYSYI